MNLGDLKKTVEALGKPPPSRLIMNRKLFREFVDAAVTETIDEPEKVKTVDVALPSNCVALFLGIEVYVSDYLPYGMIFDQDMNRIA